jgi:hypothetical protein
MTTTKPLHLINSITQRTIGRTAPWQDDPESDCGWVAEISSEHREEFARVLRAAGYAVSLSEGAVGEDDEGVEYIWVSTSAG